MSRAFVKENDQQADVVVRAVRSHPGYLTPAGYAELTKKVQAARAAGDPALAALELRLEQSVLLDPADQPRDRIGFGATVKVERFEGRPVRQAYRIVGDDEADPLRGTIGWSSPLAQALLERRAGESVTWVRPAGNLRLRILSFDYE